MPMGKTSEEKEKIILPPEDKHDEELPIPLPTELKLQKLFGGKYIAICNEQIIAVDSSLKILQEKLHKLRRKNQSFIIDFIEESVGIYGS